MQADIRIETWPLARPFAIARETIKELSLVHLTIAADGVSGQAEAAGVDYHGETAESVAAEIEAYLSRFDTLPSRARLMADLPPGGARNAIDCALWDWEAKAGRLTPADLQTLARRNSVETVYTLSLDSPAEMAAAVAFAPANAALKLKLGGRDGRDVARVESVRQLAPGRRLIVDVNEGWSPLELFEHVPCLARLGVELIEQPVPRGQDDALIGYDSPVPLCADESCDTAADLPRLGGYRFVNIKLDKCGGLTAALELVAAARVAGKRLMVGSMLGTSLGMAPAFVIAQYCDFADLDGPLLLARDRDRAMRFDGATVHAPSAKLWGVPA